MLVSEDGNHESVMTQIEISDPVAHELYSCVPNEGVCQVEDFTAPTFQPPRSAAESDNLKNANGEMRRSLPYLLTRRESAHFRRNTSIRMRSGQH